MKKCIKNGIVSIVASIFIEVVFACLIASDYFIGGLATSHLQQALTLIKFFIPNVIAIYWICNMSFTASLKREEAERFLVLVIQYVCAATIYSIGGIWLKNQYLTWLPEAFENSHLWMKYALLLVIALFPITDFRRWNAAWTSNYEMLSTIGKRIGSMLTRVGQVCFLAWKKLADVVRRSKAMIIAVATILWTYIMVETYTNHPFYEISWKYMIWNLLLYAVLYLLLWVVIRSVKWTSIVYLVFFVLVGITNYYVIMFRGNPVVLGDLTVVSTALSVAGGFKYSIDKYFIAATVPAVLLLILLFRIHTSKEKKTYEKKHLVRYVAQVIGTYLLVFVLGFFAIKSEFLYNRMEPLGWNLILQSNTNGYLLSFIGDSTKSIVDEPDDYNLETLRELLDEVEDGFDITSLNVGIAFDSIQSKTGASSDVQNPNIIVIMNESFSDLSVLGELETDVDYMPYVKSLTEDTIYGNLYVSPYGGNTVFSEFEFLTGSSMAFLPTGSIPYTQYINTKIETPSLVSVLENQETPYSTVAIHPYERSGYNRVDVYNSFGFDQFITIDDFSDYTINRKFMQDEDDYQKVIETFESKEDGQPMFIFNITMQNHGGYGERTDYVLNEPVHVTNYSVDIGVDEYLSSLKEADTAVQTLIEYFSNIDEPTIILFFGDHQPQLTTTFYDSIFGKDSTELTLEETMQKHIVPFFIWSNYEDYGGQYIDQISTNYLSSILMELAGLELTDYQKFLLELHDEYPVINAVGTVNSTGTFTTVEEKLEEDDWLTTYEMLQYNYLFDDEERLNQYLYPFYNNE